MKELTVLVAHGSSDLDWAKTFVEMTKPACEKFENAKLAFMELSTPSIQDVIGKGVKEGYQRFVVLPLFLAKGKHLKKDIPRMLKALEEEHEIETELLPAMGEHPALARAVIAIIEETLS